MGESRQPATCRKCGIVGPRRSGKCATGWVRLSGGSGRRPIWLCQACAAADLTPGEISALAAADRLPRRPREAAVIEIITDIFDRESRERMAASTATEAAS